MNKDIRQELMEALDEYIDSCNNQSIIFDEHEAKRYLRECDHMHITEAEREYIFSRIELR